MVKDLILHAPVLSFLLDAANFQVVVARVELIQFLELYDAILVGVNFLEEGPDLVGFQTQVEVLTKVDLEVAKCQETVLVGVKSHKCLLNIHRIVESLLH